MARSKSSRVSSKFSYAKKPAELMAIHTKIQNDSVKNEEVLAVHDDQMEEADQDLEVSTIL
jgi:hypothetical protein